MKVKKQKEVMPVTFEEKVKFIGSKYVLRVEMWRDGSQSWRAGIDWFGEDMFEFICEQPTLDECLDLIIKYINGEIS